MWDTLTMSKEFKKSVDGEAGKSLAVKEGRSLSSLCIFY